VGKASVIADKNLLAHAPDADEYVRGKLDACDSPALEAAGNN
jgi:hypothetical protein